MSKEHRSGAVCRYVAKENPSKERSFDPVFVFFILWGEWVELRVLEALSYEKF